jgi:hypothetical protein
MIAAGLVIGGSGVAEAKPKPEQVPLLFVLEAQRAWTTTDADGELEISLVGIDPEVLFFSDRPARVAGTVPSTGFFAEWKSLGFVEEPPNAAVVVPQGPPGRRPTAVELGRPRYDDATATVTFPLLALDGQESSWLDDLTVEEAEAHGTIDLFIDPAIDINIINRSDDTPCIAVYQRDGSTKCVKSR